MHKPPFLEFGISFSIKKRSFYSVQRCSNSFSFVLMEFALCVVRLILKNFLTKEQVACLSLTISSSTLISTPSFSEIVHVMPSFFRCLIVHSSIRIAIFNSVPEFLCRTSKLQNFKKSLMWKRAKSV